MGFGNPYGDPYDAGIVEQFTDILTTLNVSIVSLADTIGVAEPVQIEYLFKSLIKNFRQLSLGRTCILILKQVWKN